MREIFLAINEFLFTTFLVWVMAMVVVSIYSESNKNK